MPEDQNYDGSIWTREAGQLLKLFRWTQIGDFDVDIKTSDSKERGIDILFNYKIFNKNTYAGTVVEAKSYNSDVFFKNKRLLEAWIDTLFEKVTSITSSEYLQELYPQTSSTLFKDGLILIWFKDTDNYNANSDRFLELYKKIKIIKSSSGISSPNRIFVLENSNILRLLSLGSHIKELNSGNCSFVFHYPSDYQSSSVIQSEVLSIEFMFSKFILGEQKNVHGKTQKKVVFYFGNLNLKSFYRLKSALTKLQFLNKDTDLIIYSYKRHEDFRKIYPEVKKLFSGDIEDGGHDFDFLEMDRISDLPSWLTSIKY